MEENKPHPGSENLIPFKPGESGNPSGRPIGVRNAATVLREIANQEIDFFDPILKKQVKKSIGDIIAMKLVSKATAGDIKAIDQFYDRTEGKAPQTIAFDSPAAGGIKVEVIHTIHNREEIKNVEHQGNGGSSQEPTSQDEDSRQSGIDKIE